MTKSNWTIISVAMGVALALAKAIDKNMKKGLLTMHLKLMVRVLTPPLFVSSPTPLRVLTSPLFLHSPPHVLVFSYLGFADAICSCGCGFRVEEQSEQCSRLSSLTTYVYSNRFVVTIQLQRLRL
jgi:hypothetical protein